MSPVSSSLQLPSTAPFAGLVICVTGLSKGVDSFHGLFYSLYFVSFFQSYFKPLAKFYKIAFLAFFFFLKY